ncbi:MAG: hypothetical protein RJB62_1659 [Pseudomonadota bacterium]
MTHLLLTQAQNLHRLGDLAGAESHYRAALRDEPENPDILYGLGVALHQLNRLDEALAIYDALLVRYPSIAEVHGYRAIVFSMLDRHEEALSAYDRAVALGANQPGLWSNRGNALLALGRHKEALASFDRALRLEPRHAEGHYNKGVTLAALGDIGAAIIAFGAAIALQPSYADALEYHGMLLSQLHRYDAALADFDAVLALREGSAATHYNRANALSVLKRFDEAAKAAAEALRLDPDYPYARGVLVHSQLSVCDWEGLDEQAAKIEAALRDGKRTLSPFEYLALCPSAEQQWRCAEIWMSHLYPPQSLPLWRGERYGHKRLRVAYLSADFCNHPVAILMAGVFEHHDRSRFEIFGVSFTPEHESPLRTRLENAFEHFVEVRSKTDGQIAKLLREWEIDIAVDLMGYTRECRTGILAHRPAPVQVNYLGYPGTMGAPYIDYILADKVTIPEEQQQHYREAVAYLPHTYLPHDSRTAPAGPPPTRAEAGLPETGFIFACFNGPYKFSAPLFDVWMRLLRDVPGSVLWLSRQDREAMWHLRQAAALRGIAPERILFATYAEDWNAHIARLRLADLFLDTSPYGAHTTASDALWAGVPVLTFAGETFAGRVAASLLTAAQMPELIAASLADYESRALNLARHPAALSRLREALSRNRETSPLFDTARFCRNLEAVYREMGRRAGQGEKARTLIIDDDAAAITT